LVELQPSKLNVASSNLVSRSMQKFSYTQIFKLFGYAHVAQLVERFLGKEEVHQFDSGHGLHNNGSEGLKSMDRKNIHMISGAAQIKRLPLLLGQKVVACPRTGEYVFSCLAGKVLIR
jgi:hypothetical protein